MYKNIINPKTGRKVSIYGKIGKKILNNYIKFIGGAARIRQSARQADSEVVNDSGWAADNTEERIQKEISHLRRLRVRDWRLAPNGTPYPLVSDRYLRSIVINNLKNVIPEEQIQQEMLSLEEHEYRRGDWPNTDYLREIAIYNLNHPADKNITRPTRIPYNRNVFLRRDYGDGRLFLTAFPDGLTRKYVIYPGDIKYAETKIYDRIRPERMQEDEMRESEENEIYEDEESSGDW